MQIEKTKVVELLRERGLDARADWVDRTLPDQVDRATNYALLDLLQLTAEDLRIMGIGESGTDPDDTT